MSLSPSVELARDLIRLESNTPDDAGCQELLSDRLKKIGFTCEQIDSHDVKNLWAVRGETQPRIVLAGHTDVVPTGPLDQWNHPPFDGVIEGEILHGRGAADMKGSVACFVIACETFVAKYPEHSGSIGLLITSDEEGPANYGTKIVVEELKERSVQIDMCIVGEPTSVNRFGDMAKIGRRGSVGGKLIIKGKQGHIAYPHLAHNPIHYGLNALLELVNTEWDQGNKDFPPTSFQFSNISGGTGATNVIPGQIELLFNFRYSPELTDDDLKNRVKEILDRHGEEYEISWERTSYPYYTSETELIDIVRESVMEIVGEDVEFTTTGGTSDGRFIATMGTQVVELGPINATIHQINEQVSTSDLDSLTQCYVRILEKVLVDAQVI